MSSKKLEEKIGLGGYTTQPQNYGSSFRAIPIETIELRGLNEMEVKQ